MTCDKIRDLTAVELGAVGGGLTFAIGLLWNISKTLTGGVDLSGRWGTAAAAPTTAGRCHYNVVFTAVVGAD